MKLMVFSRNNLGLRPNIPLSELANRRGGPRKSNVIPKVERLPRFFLGGVL